MYAYGIRRLIRESYQQTVPASLRAGAERGLDVIIIADPGFLPSQAQNGTPFGFSRSDSDTQPRRKPMTVHDGFYT